MLRFHEADSGERTGRSRRAAIGRLGQDLRRREAKSWCNKQACGRYGGQHILGFRKQHLGIRVKPVTMGAGAARGLRKEASDLHGGARLAKAGLGSHHEARLGMSSRCSMVLVSRPVRTGVWKGSGRATFRRETLM
jgi:hypothetical protein